MSARRIRSIKPELPESESIGRLSRDGRLLFILLFTLADDDGRLRGASRLIASQLYPYDEDAAGLIDGWLAEVEREGLIVRYEVAGARYASITGWKKHQKIDKPSASKLPPPSEPSKTIPRDFDDHSAKPRETSTTDQYLDLDPERKGTGNQDLESSLRSVSSPAAPVCDAPVLGGQEFEVLELQAWPEAEGEQRVSKRCSPADDAGFERFWAAYPKKAGKGDARNAWKKARSKASLEQILNALAAQRFSPEERYQPHPATWLNGERWLDEGSTGDPVLRAAGLLDERKSETVPDFLRLT
jgi:hypothetical protein